VLAMIVEDDDLLRELLTENLEEAGWQVLGTQSAELALSVDDFTPHVLLTDVNLGPGLNGIHLAERARQKWSPLGIVIMSGRPLPRGTPLAWRERFLRKPFELATLLSCMQEVLVPGTTLPDPRDPARAETHCRSPARCGAGHER